MIICRLYIIQIWPHIKMVFALKPSWIKKRGADSMVFNRKKVDAPVRYRTIVSNRVWCSDIEWWHVHKLKLLKQVISYFSSLLIIIVTLEYLSIKFRLNIIQTKCHYQPPEPWVLTRSKVGRVFDDECPLCQRQSKTSQRTVTRGNSVTETHQ